MSNEYADQRAHDVAWMTAAERQQMDEPMPAQADAVRDCSVTCYAGCPHDPGEGHSPAGFAANH